jgi:hypothetical protein
MIVTPLSHNSRDGHSVQAREAFQRRLLTYLYRGPESSGLVLKGGAAMRVLIQSARYSMVLDFDHDPLRAYSVSYHPLLYSSFVRTDTLAPDLECRMTVARIWWRRRSANVAKSRSNSR